MLSPDEDEEMTTEKLSNLGKVALLAVAVQAADTEAAARHGLLDHCTAQDSGLQQLCNTTLGSLEACILLYSLSKMDSFFKFDFLNILEGFVLFFCCSNILVKLFQ